jgi:anti-sigma factor RsiW
MSTDQSDYKNEHQKVWELLPAIVNGTADGTQARRVEHHLGECSDCRAELARERKLREALRLPARHAPDVELGFQRLSRRLDQADGLASTVRSPRRGFPRFAGMALVSIGLVELVALAALLIAGARLVVPAGNDSPAVYRTLSHTPEQAVVRVRLRLMFDSARPLREFQATLLAHDLVVVDGPSETGVWSLGFGPGPHDAEAVVRALRQVPGVTFAEPVGLPGP